MRIAVQFSRQSILRQDQNLADVEAAQNAFDWEPYIQKAIEGTKPYLIKTHSVLHLYGGNKDEASEREKRKTLEQYTVYSGADSQ